MKLSVVVCSRNDDHGGHMLERFGLFVSSLQDETDRYGVKTELIVVDWNPPGWSYPLADVMPIPGETENLEIRVISVPPYVHLALQHSQKLPIFQMIAKNVGVRRATHDWILCTNPDVILDGPLEYAAKLPPEDTGCVYRVFRNDTTLTWPLPTHDLEKIRKICLETGYDQNDEEWNGVHSHACGDWTMMHKDSWHRFRGYLELEMYSIHIDTVLLLTAVQAGMKEVVWEDALIHHPDHQKSWSTAADQIQSTFPCLGLETVKLFAQMTQYGKRINLNPEDWGYANEVFDEVQIT